MKYQKLLWLVPVVIMLTHCQYENEEELFGQEGCGIQPASLTEDVIPIINANCAISGCHVTGFRSPDFSKKENIITAASSIKFRTQSRTMPPSSSGKSLSLDEIETISCWVDNGAHED